MINLLERPCSKCGITLEKGVRIIALADVASGSALLILWSFLLNIVIQEPPKQVQPLTTNQTSNGSKLEVDSEIRWEIPVFITLLSFSAIQFAFGILLYVGQSSKSISILYTWLAISGLSIPANGLIIKIYEMLVVYTYSYEIRCEAQLEAIKQLREHPHICIVTTQLYPGPKWEQKESLPKVAFYESKTLDSKDQPDLIFKLRHHKLSSLSSAPHK